MFNLHEYLNKLECQLRESILSGTENNDEEIRQMIAYRGSYKLILEIISKIKKEG